jgi:hypothetical protein
MLNLKKVGQTREGEAGNPSTPSPGGESSGISRASPIHETPFPLNLENVGPCPKGSVATATASAAEPASIAASSNQRPTGSWLKFGSSRLLLGAEAGYRDIQSGGRPNPWRRNPQAVNPLNLSVNRTAYRGKHTINHPWRKNKGGMVFLYEGGGKRYLPEPGEDLMAIFLPRSASICYDR